MFKIVLTGLALASGLTFAPAAMAQTQRESVVQSIVQPAAGRQALPVGTIIQGGTDLGTSIAGATVVLPSRQVLYDVVVGQVLRNNEGRAVGGTIAGNIALVPLNDGGQRGAGMVGQASPGLIGAVALGAALALGGGGGGGSGGPAPTVTHGGPN